MNFESETILGFLTGSVATIIINQIFNYFNKKTEFNRELKKIKFSRTLEISEKAVSYYYTYFSKVSEIKKSIDKFATTLKDLDNSQDGLFSIQKLIESNSQSLFDLGENHGFNINGVNLYFDLENDNDWNEDDLAKLLDCLAKTDHLNNELLFWTKEYEKYEELNDQRTAEFCISKTDEIRPTYIEALDEYSNLLSKNLTAMRNRIKKIREEIK